MNISFVDTCNQAINDGSLRGVESSHNGDGGIIRLVGSSASEETGVGFSGGASVVSCAEVQGQVDF